MKTLLDFKTPREKNTTNEPCGTYLYRVLINNKLFVANNNITVFVSLKDAIDAIKSSDWWSVVREHVDCSAEFFGFGDDDQFRDNFEKTIWENMIKTRYIQFKCYKLQ